MSNDRYALWISHSSINDFLKCPKSYYFKHIYRNPKTNNKITIISPSLALGQTVHEVIENLASKKKEERFSEPLLDTFEVVWQKITGEKGGFRSIEEEEEFKTRGKAMLKRVIDNPGPLLNLALKLHSPDPNFSLPRYYFSTEKQIILCGKIDWMEYVPDSDSVHIIDFKTGKHDEDPSSLQLAIYCLLVQNCQKRKIHKVSYWYLDRDTSPKEVEIPDYKKAANKLMEIALKMKAARNSHNFECLRNGCFACKPLIDIVNGKARYVGANEYQDIYVVN